MPCRSERWRVGVGRRAPCSYNERRRTPLHSKPQSAPTSLGVAMPWFLCCLPNGWNCPSSVAYLSGSRSRGAADLDSGRRVPWCAPCMRRARGSSMARDDARLSDENLKSGVGSRDPVLARAKRSSLRLTAVLVFALRPLPRASVGACGAVSHGNATVDPR
ncbi:hypothetical protein AAG906_039187 [Vitis piasezkii]